jgi:hypothetical protein
VSAMKGLIAPILYLLLVVGALGAGIWWEVYRFRTAKKSVIPRSIAYSR